VSVPHTLLGAGALVMALCCALLPLAGAAVVYTANRRRTPGGRC
jgi:hypothetical protein